MNSATSGCGGPREQLLRRADLADHAVAQHHDAVGQRQRLLLVVRDVDRGRSRAWRGCGGSRPASPAAAWRRGWTAARPSAPAAARPRWRGRSRRAAAGRRRAGPGSLSSCPCSRTSAIASSTRRAISALATPLHQQAEADVRAHASCAGTARSSGTPCRSRAAPAAACRCAARPARCRRRSAAAGRRGSSAPSTCRSRTGRAGR